jgi:hypothetical protein
LELYCIFNLVCIDSFLLYENTSGFCMFLLGPVILLNSLSSSISYFVDSVYFQHYAA